MCVGSVDCIADAALSQLIKALALGDGRRVVNLANALLTFALPEKEPSGARMRHDVPSHGLLWVNRICHSSTRICSHLVRDKDCNIELFGNLLQTTHHLIEDLLAFCQLSSSRVIDSEWRHDRVNHKK